MRKVTGSLTRGNVPIIVAVLPCLHRDVNPLKKEGSCSLRSDSPVTAPMHLPKSETNKDA